MNKIKQMNNHKNFLIKATNNITYDHKKKLSNLVIFTHTTHFIIFLFPLISLMKGENCLINS